MSTISRKMLVCEIPQKNGAVRGKYHRAGNHSYRKLATAAFSFLLFDECSAAGPGCGVFELIGRRGMGRQFQIRTFPSRRFQTTRAVAVGAFALGAAAIRAIAVGAMAIGRLRVLEARIEKLSIGTLTVDHLNVRSR
jgi:hypothetical protein